MTTFFVFSAQYLFILPILILSAYFFTRKWPTQKRMVFFAIPAGLLTYLLGLIGNYLYYDPRPFVVGHFTPLIAHAADNGFPSDHTLLVSSLAAIGMYWNKWLGIRLWAIALFVAFSRVYVGLHHPIDVIGSMAFAFVATSAWYVAANRIWKA